MAGQRAEGRPGRGHLSQFDPLDNVDPDLRAYVGALPDLGVLSETTLPEIRAMLGGEPPILGCSDDIEVSAIRVPGLAGDPDIPALVYGPANGKGLLPAILNIHGGGYVAGSAQREDAQMRALVARLGCVALVPDYRLAPESPYPAALRDCQASMETLRTMPDVDPARIAVRGVSAGGGLALALGLLARDEGGFEVAHLHLIYPMLDDRTGPDRHNGHFVWTAAANQFAWNALLAGVDRDAPPPYAVPARAMDLSGLPPVFLAVGAIDLFAQEALSVGARLISAGVPVEMHVYPGAFHGFNLVADSPVAKAFDRDSCAAIERYLHHGRISE